MKEIAFIENSNERRPYFFKQCRSLKTLTQKRVLACLLKLFDKISGLIDFRYVLTDHLIVFYHADGEGMSLEDMHGLKEYSDLNAELKLRAAKTHDIMRLFFVEVFIYPLT